MSPSLTVAVAAELSGDVARFVRETSGEGLSVEPHAASTAELMESVGRREVDAACVPAGAVWSPEGRGLTLAAVLVRQEPRDVLVPATASGVTLRTLEPAARVAVAGRYRAELLRVHRPDARIVDCSNGRTPVGALADGTADAAILCAAQARRAGLAERVSEILDPKEWVPTPGQGGLVVLIPPDRPVPREIARLDDFRSRVVLEAERALGDLLGIERSGPLGALAMPYGRWIRLWAMIPRAEGRRLVRCDVSGSDTTPVEVARTAADLLGARGARMLLA